MMYEIGRVCVKIAGRDAGKKCVIVEQIDSNYVLIDGATRRRKCNISHLEPTKEVFKLKASADHAAVAKAFESAGITLKEQSKSKEATSKPRKSHKQNEKKPTTSKKAKK